MPTPMPIIVANVVEKLCNGYTCVSRPMIASPTEMPASATTIGSTIASTEPNAISRMKIAARMPMPSPESDGRSRLLDELTAEPHFELRRRVLLGEVDHLPADRVGNVLRLRVELRVRPARPCPTSRCRPVS